MSYVLLRAHQMQTSESRVTAPLYGESPHYAILHSKAQ